MDVGGLSVARELHDFVETEALAGVDLDPRTFWAGFAELVADLRGPGRALLAERDRLQTALDVWHAEHRGAPWDAAAYRAHLEQIGYLVPETSDAEVTTRDVDPELASVAGPQLVVPVTNARYLLNAANARWGSLYDALYGTDALPGAARPGGYDRARGAQVVDAVRGLLDELFPLAEDSHRAARGYTVEDGALVVSTASGTTTLADPDAFRGWQGDPSQPEVVLLRRHGLHWEIRLDPSSTVGADDPAGVSDVVVEAATTAIVDFEDSVAVVDAADKVAAYRNWLGLNRGDLQATFDKRGRQVVRRLEPDRTYRTPDGELVLPGRAVLLVRNVGHLMTSDAVLDADGDEIGEGILDAVVTALCAVPGLDPASTTRNGSAGSLYVVKPKMHGPAEVAYTVRLFERVERLLGLAPETIKLGLMDEERRTSANLGACIAEASTRLVFINTGFLDRSGDEIHTALEAGPVVRKAELRRRPWMAAYEDRNVDLGLRAGLAGHGQIGKGMWAMPDRMAEMLEQKVAQPLAGASTAWVPSPTAAVLHALHYARVDVHARQRELAGRAPAPLEELLTPPLADPSAWDERARLEEVDENVQSLLGYVVRWVDAGVGCSKVPDVHDVALMEDRATLRISSQLLANWLHHGVVDEAVVRASLQRMAAVVDGQNAADPDYRPMATDLDGSIAFRAACDLVFEGARQPNGYTEPILHRRRREAKAARTAVAA
ncbi:malate synthase G [Microlunatus flavus]|uniref:Malate synthase G n=1 Tax=Microlunatus flavus TaxID=1036181 RepID=A0A1H9A9E0_9ACTN|nr:malate synthase G [Microlunatus flavus]SEP73161.1 malate synthase [Microlunatus flavus]